VLNVVKNTSATYYNQVKIELKANNEELHMREAGGDIVGSVQYVCGHHWLNAFYNRSLYVFKLLYKFFILVLIYQEEVVKVQNNIKKNVFVHGQQMKVKNNGQRFERIIK